MPRDSKNGLFAAAGCPLLSQKTLPEDLDVLTFYYSINLNTIASVVDAKNTKQGFPLGIQHIRDLESFVEWWL